MLKFGGEYVPEAEWELELEKRIGQEGDDLRDDLDPLEVRIRALEAWKAAEEAVSTIRRWLIPVVTGMIGGGLTLFNVIMTATRKH